MDRLRKPHSRKGLIGVMPHLRLILKNVVPIAFAGLLALAAPSARAGPADAGAFLVALNKAAIETLNDTTISEDQRHKKFRKLAQKSFDVPSISKFVLGINWRRATPAQREEFLDVFEDVNLQRFMPLFTKYADQVFTVTKVRQHEEKPRLYFVTSTISREEAPTATVEWRITKRDDEYKILDVVAEGVSMALTLRKEYGSVVKNSGLDGLIAQLREKVKSDSAPVNATPQ
jgi:phospholipid transport system substrate-binding protein